MKTAEPLAPVNLAIALGATTPVPSGGAGSIAWSTTTGGPLAWNGSAWVSLPLTDASGDVAVPGSGSFASITLPQYGAISNGPTAQPNVIRFGIANQNTYLDFYRSDGSITSLDTSGGAVAGVSSKALGVSTFGGSQLWALDENGNLGIKGALTAGPYTGNTLPGDVAAGRSASVGILFLGSNGSQSLDFGLAHSGAFTFDGGPLYASVFNGSGAGLTAGTIPNGALVTTPIDTSATAQTKSGTLQVGQLNIGSASTFSVSASILNIGFLSSNSGTIRFYANGGSNAATQQAQSGGNFLSLGSIVPGNGTANGTAGYYSGTGAPTFSAPNGSQYLRYDGAMGTRRYVNQSGASSSGTTWVAVAGE
jgi:hypothetical protein